MSPAQPPLPTAWNLPFQPDDGIHTSTLMSESADGFSVAATRHTATGFANPCAAFDRPLGGLENAPAGTSSALVMVVFDALNESRLSQDD